MFFTYSFFYYCRHLMLQEYIFRDSDRKSIYSVASGTVTGRCYDSRFCSDAKNLEEDIVVEANIPDETEDVEFNKRVEFS